MEDTGIAMLRPGGIAPELEVRVVRCWKPAFRDNEVCYVFVDKEGMGIQAMAKGRDQRIITSKLQVHKCYKINGYACVDPDKYTSTLSHPAYMRIGSASVFTPVPDNPELPDQYFEFINRQRLEALHSKSKDPNETQNRVLLDYIGILQSLEDNTTNIGKPYVVITLRDCSNQNVTIRLWEEIVSSSARFPRIAIESSSQPTILALTALRLTDFMGRLQLQSTNATHVYVNPSTVESRLLLSMFDRLGPNALSEETQHETARQQTSEEPNTTVSQLQAKEPRELKGHNFTIKGAVTEIDTNKEWHCVGCPKCDQSLMKVGDGWFCSMHGNLSVPSEIYRITATISDNTGSIPVLIFNDPSATLTGMTCTDILGSHNPDVALHKIINKTAIFHVQANKNNRTEVLRCTVTKVYIIRDSTADTPAPTTPSSFQPVHGAETSTSTKRRLFAEESISAEKKAKED